MQETVRILGVDPGLRHMGWGVIDTQGPRLSWVAHGVVKPNTKLSLAERLGHLASELKLVVDAHMPDVSAVEETFVNVNPKSTLLLGQARGAAMTALALANLPVSEFAARKIKQAVVGSGAADKDQIAFMVRRLLPKAGEVKADAADALAVAVCCAHHQGQNALDQKLAGMIA